MRRRVLLSGAAVVAAGGLAGCLGILEGHPVFETFSETYTVSPDTPVVVSNRNGPVDITRTDGDVVTVSGEKRAESQSGLDDITIDVVEGAQLVIQAQFGSESGISNRRVSLSVGLPAGVPLAAANTTNGDVTVTDVEGDVTAGTVNGTVDVDDVDGFVRVQSTNGDVRSRNCTGLRGARTTNGEVDVDVLAMRGDVSCRTSNGDVTARVGPEVAAAFRLSTTIGNASVRDVPHSTAIDRDDYITGQIRDGEEPLLVLEANIGDVTLRSA
jgi:DUF4097 and DUF4098 domain-containing protein YvlB